MNFCISLWGLLLRPLGLFADKKGERSSLTLVCFGVRLIPKTNRDLALDIQVTLEAPINWLLPLLKALDWVPPSLT